MSSEGRVAPQSKKALPNQAGQVILPKFTSKSSHFSRNRVDKGTQRGQEFHPLVPFIGREHEKWGQAYDSKQNLMHMGAQTHACAYVQGYDQNMQSPQTEPYIVHADLRSHKKQGNYFSFD